MALQKDKFSDLLLSVDQMDNKQLNTLAKMMKMRRKELRSSKVEDWKDKLEKGKSYKLNDGSIPEVIEVKRTRFLGSINGKKYNVPISMIVEEA